MRRISVLLVGAITVLVASGAYAATDTGVVISVNPNDHVFELSDEMVFFTPPSIDLGGFQIGYTVTVTYTREKAQGPTLSGVDSSNNATAVDILFPRQPGNK